ncbi:MAG TPA: 30S ribosomal protein S13 [Candidatus Azoamicus sp. OHIO1]
MVRISGVVLPQNKHIVFALREIYGIGRTCSIYICKKAKISPSVKVSGLNEESFFKLQQIVNEFEVEGDLRRRVAINVKRLRDIKCYKGIRHKLGLPVRGQRTRTNAKTRKRSKRKK